MTTTRRILVIESDSALRRSLRDVLNEDGWLLAEANTGESFLSLARHLPMDLVILDAQLPDMDGLAVVRAMRKWSDRPILVISRQFDESYISEVFEAGADECMKKPIRMMELRARVRALMRRTAVPGTPPQSVFEIGEMRIDLATRKVSLGDRQIPLTQREFSMLAVLAQNAGRIVPGRKLLDEVWGEEYEDATSVRMYIAKLRQKLEADSRNPVYLRTQSGIGYKLDYPATVKDRA